jgi:hypothetical protein
VKALSTKLMLLAATAVAVAAVMGVTAQSASASYVGHAYIVVSNANCVGGGQVTGIFGAVDTVWSGGDWGDNIIYPAVRIGASNTFNARAYCDRPWWDPRGDYWVNIIWKVFTPSYNNQTFWF